MSELKVMLWVGGNAPNREAKLTISDGGYFGEQFAAYWEPGYCGCPDCHPLVGWGATEQEAIADYWEKWEEKAGLVGSSNIPWHKIPEAE